MHELGLEGFGLTVVMVSTLKQSPYGTSLVIDKL